MGHQRRAHTCEHVRAGHPDKLCDQVADAIVDQCLLAAAAVGEARTHHPDHIAAQRFGLEILAKGYLVVLSGEMRLGPNVARQVDFDAIVRETWAQLGYLGAEHLTIINHIQAQQPELQASSDRLGAGDQGIMVGYACEETPCLLPTEYVVARDICMELDRVLSTKSVDWIRPDGKAQVSVGAGGDIQKIVVGVQHTEVVAGLTRPSDIQEHIHQYVAEQVIPKVLGRALSSEAIVVNGTGSFAIGGPVGDAGVVGRKIVVDAYGPRVAVGGGAFSGKDPTKVDRSGAYMARHIARAALGAGVHGARSVTVHLAYAIGGRQPEMVAGFTEDGQDLSAWIRDNFVDLAPTAIAERFDLWRPSAKAGWSYRDTARYGHFGRPHLPWER